CVCVCGPTVLRQLLLVGGLVPQGEAAHEALVRGLQICDLRQQLLALSPPHVLHQLHILTHTRTHTHAHTHTHTHTHSHNHTYSCTHSKAHRQCQAMSVHDIHMHIKSLMCKLGHSALFSNNFSLHYRQ